MQKEHKTIIRVHKGCIVYIFKKIINISIYRDISYRYIDKRNDQLMTALLEGTKYTLMHVPLLCKEKTVERCVAMSRNGLSF